MIQAVMKKVSTITILKGGLMLALFLLMNSFVSGNIESIGDTNEPPKLKEDSPIFDITFTGVRHVSCHGGVDGRVTAVPANGQIPYSYFWSTGSNSATITNLSTGIYTITIVDGANDFTEASFEITEPDEIIIDVVSQTVISCEEPTGTSVIEVNGGTPSYFVIWSSGSTGMTGTNLAPGENMVTIIDDNICTESLAIDIIATEVPPLIDAGENIVLDCNNLEANLNGSISECNNCDFIWTTQDGNIAQGAETLHPLINAGGTYILSVIDNDIECIQQDEVVVLEDNALPLGSAGEDVLMNCNEPAMLNGSVTDCFNCTFEWITEDGHILEGADTPNPFVDADGLYFVFITDPANGCFNIDAVSVSHDIPPPVVDTGEDIILDCNNIEATLNASVTNCTDCSYLWNTEDGNIATGSETLNPLINSEGTYVLTAINNTNGCVGTDEVIVIEGNDLPAIELSNEMALTCENTSLALAVSAPGCDACTFEWETEDGNILEGADTANPLIDAPGLYFVFVTQPSNGCFNIDAVTVTVESTPFIISAGPDITLDCNNIEATPNASIQDCDNCSFLWTSPDGNIAEGVETLNPLVNSGGMYVLTAVNNDNGCLSQDTVMVFEDAGLPPIDAGQDMVITCTPTVTLNGDSPGCDNCTYEWTTDDGNIVQGADSKNPIVNAPGMYFLFVTDPSNGCFNIDAASVTIAENPILVDAGADILLDCNNLEATLSASVDGCSDCTYLWSTTDGNIASGSETLTPMINTAGTYFFTATNTEDNCMALDSLIVTENDAIPDLEVIQEMTINCEHSTVALNVVSPDCLNCTFEWETDTGNIVEGESTSQPVVDAPGMYFVFVTDPFNGCFNIESVTVSMDVTPPILDAGPDITLDCNNLEVNLQAGVSECVNCSFLWTTPDGNIVNGQETLSPLVNSGGTYVLFAQNAENTCMSSDTVLVELNDAIPLIEVGETVILDCEIPEVTLSASAPECPSCTFEWMTEDGHIIEGGNTANPLVNAQGQYFVFVTDPSNGCFNIESVTVLQNMDLPVVNAGGDFEIACEPIALNATVSNCTSCTYSWSSTDGNIVAGEQTLFPVIDAAGTYSLEVVNTESGCIANDIVIVSDDIQMNITTLEVNHPACGDEATGSVTVQVDNGSEPFVYSWSTGGGTPTENNLLVGTYTLSVTDSENCATTYEIVIEAQDDQAPVIECPADIVMDCEQTVSYDLPLVSDNCEAALTLIDGLDSGATFPVGETTVTYLAEDMAGNTASCSFVVDIPEPMSASLSVTQPLCAGETGNIVMSIQGGTAPYLFDWSEGQSGSDINVPEGTYEVTVVDAFACSFITSATIEAPPAITLSVDEITNETNTDGDGAIQVSVSGGVPPYVFEWYLDEELIAENQNIDSLASAEYQIQISDANGCLFLSDPILVDRVTGTKIQLLQETVRIYPNPGYGTFYLEWKGEMDIIGIDIFASNGKKVLSFDDGFSGGTFSFNMDGFSAGMYFLLIQTKEGSGSWKFEVK